MLEQPLKCDLCGEQLKDGESVLTVMRYVGTPTSHLYAGIVPFVATGYVHVYHLNAIPRVIGAIA